MKINEIYDYQLWEIFFNVRLNLNSTWVLAFSRVNLALFSCPIFDPNFRPYVCVSVCFGGLSYSATSHVNSPKII